MRFIFFLVMFFSLSASAQVDIGSIITDDELRSVSQEVVQNIGLNCATPQNIPLFYEGVKTAISGLTTLASEIAIQTSLKPDYPTICHIISQNQLNAYDEGVNTTTEDRCIIPGPMGCKLKAKVTKEVIKPSYFWPKYLVEVSEQGNDHVAPLARANALYSLNRSIATSLQGLVDGQGSAKLLAGVFASSKVMSAVGLGEIPVSASDVAAQAPVGALEYLRVKGAKNSNSQFIDASIWPIAGSRVFSKSLSVCGPELYKIGQDPGGLGWSLDGVPQTCPIAMSSDAYTYWDTGVLDFFDPEAMAAMATAVNPMSCIAAQASKNYSDLGYHASEKLSNSDATDKNISLSGGEHQQTLKNCSWPIIGPAEAIAKKASQMGNIKKWADVKCTIWGNLSPRNGILQRNDYSYVNAALRFKMLSHDLFGVPRGASERWSLVYPWEGGGGIAENIIKDSTNALSILKTSSDSEFTDMIKSQKGYKESIRSESLMLTGSPRLVNASFSSAHLARFLKNTAQNNAIASAIIQSPAAAAAFASAEAKARSGGVSLVDGEKRVYAVWEKISCLSPSTRVTIQAPLTPAIRYYESCSAAIKFEVNKYIQTKLLRKMCDSIGQRAGTPFK